MRAGHLAIALTLFGIGLTTCGGASFLGIANFEPPHPHWQLPVADAVAHSSPERARYSDVGASDYDVSIYPAGTCTMTVRGKTGEILAESHGSSCFASITGRPGDAWTFEATATAPNATIQVAVSNPIFPSPLGRIAGGGALLALIGLAGSIAALAGRPEKPPPAPR